jgi:hypothetical protein
MCKRTTCVMVTLLIVTGWLGSIAMGQAPDRNGLVLWLDASRTDTILKDAAGKVSRWNDLSDNNYDADQTAAAQQPTYVKGVLGGKAIIDFGDSVYGNPLTTYQPWMQFRDASGAVLNISNVRTVFWVCGMDAGTNGFLLGDDNNYHFHRGQQSQFWDGANGWASANIRDGSTYLNGVKVDGTATVLPTDYSIISLVTTGNVETSMLARDRTYRSGGIKLGELLIYSRALTDDERTSVEAYLTEKWFAPAGVPQPTDGAVDVSRKATLSWAPGKGAVTHDVYFGTSFDDVSDASRADPKGVLVSQGQTDATYVPSIRFEIDQTYYWRVDEIGAAPGNAIVKGSVWSFTAEAYSIAVANVKATASSSSGPTMGPGKTVDGSGLDSAGQHSTVETDMWLSGAARPQWIRYEFSKAVKLDQMLVWNSNQAYEYIFGFGAKMVTVEHSVDGQTWTTLGEFEFAQATGDASYTANTSVPFDGVVARYVKLTIQSNWGGMAPQVGLSEVRFLHIPVAAREPDPSDGAVDVDPQTVLAWRPGREAGTHEVYVGADPNALVQAATVTEPSYEASLNLGETYYWKVDEVNAVKDPATWPGDVWSFSTLPYLVVDDFESYTNESPNRLFQAWIDGLGFSPDEFFPNGGDGNGSGAVVGYDPLAGTIVETDRVNSGGQSMPLFYDNSTAGYSEAQRTFAEPWDWSKYNITTLSLAFHGDPNNAGQMYVKINNTKVPYNGKAEDIKRTLWQPWNIDLASTGANLASVTKLAIGVDGAAPAGVLYIDDIRLYPLPGELIVPADPGTNGLVAYYKFDGNFKDSAGAHDGTALGDAKTVNDPARGQVLSLDGVGDAVDVPLLGTSSVLTISMWVNSAVDTTSIDFASFFHSDGWESGDVHWRFSYARVDGGFYGFPNLSGRSRVKPNVWYHVAAIVTPTEWALWLDGLRDGVASLGTPTRVTMGDGLIGAWLGTDGVTISRGFTGKIDDVRFYNRALSPEELAWLAGRTEPFAKPFN